MTTIITKKGHQWCIGAGPGGGRPFIGVIIMMSKNKNEEVRNHLPHTFHQYILVLVVKKIGLVCSKQFSAFCKTFCNASVQSFMYKLCPSSSRGVMFILSLASFKPPYAPVRCTHPNFFKLA